MINTTYYSFWAETSYSNPEDAEMADKRLPAKHGHRGVTPAGDGETRANINEEFPFVSILVFSLVLSQG